MTNPRRVHLVSGPQSQGLLSANSETPVRVAPFPRLLCISCIPGGDSGLHAEGGLPLLPFYLTTVEAPFPERAQLANDHCLSLREILSGEWTTCLLTNYLWTFDWLLEQCPRSAPPFSDRIC
jgi:hypothetical protein